MISGRNCSFSLTFIYHYQHNQAMLYSLFVQVGDVIIMTLSDVSIRVEDPPQVNCIVLRLTSSPRWAPIRHLRAFWDRWSAGGKRTRGGQTGAFRIVLYSSQVLCIPLWRSTWPSRSVIQSWNIKKLFANLLLLFLSKPPPPPRYPRFFLYSVRIHISPTTEIAMIFVVLEKEIEREEFKGLNRGK